ncbi:MAG: FAD-dependent oxidoreductase, partial [Clostridia bacterium]|nr:FAD-dependent oxidoreductase [Clostridia bacterium]
MFDVIVIGAGAAGLTAAIYVRRAGKRVLVLEGLSYGGQIINTPDIENYPAAPHISGFDFATRLYEQAKQLGAQIAFEKVVGVKDKDGIKEVVTSKNSYEAKALIIATGSQNKKLGLPKEDDFIGKGVSYCATCDGAFYRKKTVAVVGGGNTAVEDALYLSDLAEKVYIIHRRDQFRADERSVESLKSKTNVELVLDSVVTELLGSDRLEGIITLKKDGSLREIKADGLFVAVGRNPETS